MKLSIIIPVFRGKTILPALVKRISESLVNILDYEVLFICDKCDAESKKVVIKLSDDHNFIKAYHLARNYGQHRALLFGFGNAAGDFIVTIDEDLQHDPADIIKLVAKQKEGNYDVVYGRFPTPQQKQFKKTLSGMSRKILKHLIPELYEGYSSYRLIRREIALQAAELVSPFIFIDDFLSRITKNIASVDIIHHPRFRGRSSYNIFRLIKLGVLITLTYSGIVYWLLLSGGLFILTGFILFMFKRYFSFSVFQDSFYSLIILLMGITLLIIGLSGISIRYIENKINTRQIKLQQ